MEELFCLQLALHCREPSASRTSACGLRSVGALEPRTELPTLIASKLSHVITPVQFVVVFNLTRFARDKYDHFALRAHLKSLGISLRSATEPIDDTSTGKLMEGVLAAFAQFDNDCRSDRTRAGMQAALELGRWTFLAPLGYLNAHRSTSRSLIPDPERGPLVRRAFQDFATGRFTKHKVRKNINALGFATRKAGPLADVRRHAAEPRLHRADRRS
jgi:site-specific DNA recombinase